jgi:hypothetical protein
MTLGWHVSYAILIPRIQKMKITVQCVRDSMAINVQCLAMTSCFTCKFYMLHGPDPCASVIFPRLLNYGIMPPGQQRTLHYL